MTPPAAAVSELERIIKLEVSLEREISSMGAQQRIYHDETSRRLASLEESMKELTAIATRGKFLGFLLWGFLTMAGTAIFNVILRHL